MLIGLLVARAGYADGDSIAALFVAVLVLAAAIRLMRRNIDVLMDRAPAEAEAAARRAIVGRGADASSCGACGCARPPGASSRTS